MGTIARLREDGEKRGSEGLTKSAGHVDCYLHGGCLSPRCACDGDDIASERSGFGIDCKNRARGTGG